jgi:hypothetical protein
MAEPKFYMVELKVHVFNFSLAEGWAVIAGPKAFISEHKVHVSDLILA